MPKHRKFELICCTHFNWRLTRREGVYSADGRSNKLNVGRHSLGTREREEALRRLTELDAVRAADFGLIPRPIAQAAETKVLILEDGRRLYEEHLARPLIAGGVREGTRKRYRTVFDKFGPFAKSIGVDTWNGVDRIVLENYASHLLRIGYKTPRGKKKEYRHKTLHTELTTLKQSISWLIDEGHLRREKITLPLRKAESEKPYCWTHDEVEAIIDHCNRPDLRWLGEVVVGLACTGLRISELATLQWSDVDLQKETLSITDETAHSERNGLGRRRTKSGRSRSFAIHSAFLAMLRRISHTDARIFHGPRGGRLKPDTVRNALIHGVLEPLASQFPSPDGGKEFRDGRLHSFRHYFCSQCANMGVPEIMVMEWLGHAASAMVRHYYHMDNKEAQRQMNRLDLIGDAGKRFAGGNNGTATQQTEVSPGRESNTMIAT